MRPSVALVATTSFTDTARCSPASTSSVASSSTANSPANARATLASRSTPSIDVRKPTRPKLTPSTGTPVPEIALQRPQHRPVAAQHDDEVGRRRVVGDDLDARVGGQRLEPGDRIPDRLRPAVRDDGRPADGLSRLQPDPGIELIREGGGLRRGRGGGRTRGFPSGREGPSLRRRPRRRPSRARAARCRAARAREPQGRGRRRASTSARPASNCGFTSGSARQPRRSRRRAPVAAPSAAR